MAHAAAVSQLPAAQAKLRPQGPTRCLTPSRSAQGQFLAPPSDCSANSTTIKAEYDAADLLEIPVVVHILTRTNGVGDITDAKVLSQIKILNDDFRAVAGSNGGPGFDTRIQFRLATIDPSGNPTSGITRTANNSWFNDSGSYWNSLAWDPGRYLNIYTNQASGALGYVPYLPQSGPAGANSDRVVVLWSSFGDNGPIGAPYNKGRTTTHEVGHYLGLYHTFDGGCGSVSNCSGSGDLICDTNRESSPSFGCPSNKSSCGSSDPVTNYMDYSDDLCMNQFTDNQSNRMRCTLMNYRSDLYTVVNDGIGTTYCNGFPNSTGQVATLSAVGSSLIGENNVVFQSTGLPSSQFGYLLMSQSQANVPNFGGSQGVLCVGNPQVRFNAQVQNSGSNGEVNFPVDLTNLPSATVFQSGQTWNFQYWTRDFISQPTSNTTLGYAITWQ